jgi:hypothetical protein
MKLRILSQLVVGVAAVFALTSVAFAGPPMICHALEIGSAKTLPWVDLNYHKGDGKYNLNALSQDTLAILDSGAPVLVRMETLRRATIYARQDPQVAKELITRLEARASKPDGSAAGALAWFDFGYLIETYKQWMGEREANPARNLDGYAWVERAIGARGADAEMEFGAALITLKGPSDLHQAHVRKALEGAKSDALLARNMASTFHDEKISALLTQPTPVRK